MRLKITYDITLGRASTLGSRRYVRRVRNERHTGRQCLGGNRPSRVRRHPGAAVAADRNDRWGVQSDPCPICMGGGAGTAVVLADRCDAVRPSVRSWRDAMARRLHHPALWRGRREEICLSRPARFPEHHGVGGQGGLRRPCNLSDRLVFGTRARAGLASGRAEQRVVISAVRGNAMSPMPAAALASVLSFVMFAIMTGLYVAPWLAIRQRAEALIPLLWVHAFRHVALQIYSAQQFGFAVSDRARDAIAACDVTCMVLAVISIVALHYLLRMAPVMVWALVAATLVDLCNATLP